LIFSRQYTQFIEQRINTEFDEDILIAHELENEYFFPINQKKIVVAVLNKGFTWFSFVTLFITFYGVSTFAWSIYQIINNEMNINFVYFILLVTLVTLSVGFWWFLSGTGEKRLERIFKKYG
jgi:magnesium-transporting ATPase (P-type)